MIGSTEYFAATGVMFTIYLIIRAGWRLETWYLRNNPPDGKPYDGPATFIDTSKIAGRVQHVKQHLAEDGHDRAQNFKKPLMVEEKRKEISQLAFFERLREPAPEESDDDHGGVLLLV